MREGEALAAGADLFRPDVKKLSKQQLGKYAEYLVKIAFLGAAFEVFTPEVDERGVDFLARRPGEQPYDVQVKSVRGLGYIYLRKRHFAPKPQLVVAVAVFDESSVPFLFLIPSREWSRKNRPPFLVDRDFPPPRVSQPEYGLTLSKRHWAELQARYKFAKVIGTL